MSFWRQDYQLPGRMLPSNMPFLVFQLFLPRDVNDVFNCSIFGRDSGSSRPQIWPGRSSVLYSKRILAWPAAFWFSDNRGCHHDEPRASPIHESVRLSIMVTSRITCWIRSRNPFRPEQHYDIHKICISLTSYEASLVLPFHNWYYLFPLDLYPCLCDHVILRTQPD